MSIAVNTPLHVHLIAAVSTNGIIGIDNHLPWRLPADLQRFKALTHGHPTIMGRKTFESIGSKPLPGRPAIVLTRSATLPETVTTVDHLGAALLAAAACDTGAVFVIGGEQLYHECITSRLADTVHLTIVHTEVTATTGHVARFPYFDNGKFSHGVYGLHESTPLCQDETSGLLYHFETYHCNRV